MSEETLATMDCTEINPDPIIHLTENGVQGFEVLCRLCANRSDHLIPIYSEEGVSNDLADKMNMYLPIKVTKSDILPLQCCFQCATTVLTWHELIVATLEADRRLREVQLEVEKQLLPVEDEGITPEPEPGTSQEEAEMKHEDMVLPNDGDDDEDDDDDGCASVKKAVIIKSQDSAENSILKLGEEKLDLNNLQNKLKSYECELCQKRYRQKMSLQRHLLVHTNERAYSCDNCNQKFIDSSAIIRHIRHVHKLEKNHSCKYCDKNFASAATRDDHQRIHTRERPFICVVCDKSFRQRASLYIHSKTHSDDFPHTCEVCKKNFRRKQELDCHFSTHTGVKPFVCEICGKSFRIAQFLKTHLLVHCNRNITYKCNVCTRYFKQLRYLNKHMRSKHPVQNTAL